jgi:hypothetical protein
MSDSPTPEQIAKFHRQASLRSFDASRIRAVLAAGVQPGDELGHTALTFLIEWRGKPRPSGLRRAAWALDLRSA